LLSPNTILKVCFLEKLVDSTFFFQIIPPDFSPQNQYLTSSKPKKPQPMAPLLKPAFLVFLLAFSLQVLAQDGTIYPLENPTEPNAILLGTGGVENQPAPETWFRQWGDPMARNISTATLTPFLPEPEKANGAAVIVAPGGGFSWLSMGNEGWEVAEALAKQGIAAFVLKYRLNPTPPALEDFSAWMNRPRTPAAPPAASTSGTPAPRPPQRDLSIQLADAEAAYAMIVNRAKEWGVDTKRIGMIGFSAGAGLTMHSTLHSKTMKLAFIGPIYGGMGPVEVPADAPPMFNVIASDDFLYNGQTGIIESWYKAGRPVEFHLYQNGGHGFGLGNPNRTSNRWFDAFMHWLEVNGFLAKI
jgi:acetyl esterase/lipase